MEVHKSGQMFQTSSHTTIITKTVCQQLLGRAAPVGVMCTFVHIFYPLITGSAQPLKHCIKNILEIMCNPAAVFYIFHINLLNVLVSEILNYLKVTCAIL